MKNKNKKKGGKNPLTNIDFKHTLETNDTFLVSPTLKLILNNKKAFEF